MSSSPLQRHCETVGYPGSNFIHPMFQKFNSTIPASRLIFLKFRFANLPVTQIYCGRPGFNPWVGKIPWRRKWQPTPVFLPGESHGRRSLVGYSPWGRKEADTTERLHHHHHPSPTLAFFMCDPWLLDKV